MSVVEVLRGSPWAQRAHSAARRLLAAQYALRGKRYAALRELCSAYRGTDVASLSARHLASIAAILRETCRHDGTLTAHRGNRLVDEFSALDQAAAIRGRFAKEPCDDRVRLRQHRETVDPGRQGNLIALKAADDSCGERGVLLLKYTPTFEEFAAVFDIVPLLQRYQLVLEPSSYCNCEPSLFLFAGADVDIVMQCTDFADRALIERSRAGIVPLSIGAADWVDADCFSPPANAHRIYDVAMVASWSKLKRHRVLFDAIARLRPLTPRIALIGYPGDLTRRDMEAEIRARGLADQCDIFQSIPPCDVANIVAQSKMAVHLSRREGTNKAAYEALFCNTPLIVFRHNRGFQMSAINGETGILADDAELAGAIRWMCEHYQDFHPRRWALTNTGCQRATEALNAVLRDRALSQGRTWTRDIVCKTNRPNLRYKRDEDRTAMEPAYMDLGRYLYGSDNRS